VSTLPFPMSLAEKYRPRAIADFVGLDKPKRILAKFAANPYASAWLFTGPPGIGKTTMALAVAETLHAELHHTPSQQCCIGNVEDVMRQCWYVPQSGEFQASVGTQDFDANCYKAFVGNGAFGPNANCGVYPQLETTPVQRTPGWHVFSVDYGASTVSVSIDGLVVLTAPVDYEFDTIQLSVSGPNWRPNTTAYFDNYTSHPCRARRLVLASSHFRAAGEGNRRPTFLVRLNCRGGWSPILRPVDLRENGDSFPRLVL
jgi:DNA polymerase III delta prime subunit